MENTNTPEQIKEAVRQRYGDIARQAVAQPQRASCCGPSQSSCCAPAQAPAAAKGRPDPADLIYRPAELSAIPAGAANASLGCGNPTAIAGLRPGETVLDLGSGGGIDCFLAARQVGPTGRVIGLDMTPDMIRLAQQNAKQAGLANVEFRYGEMEDMPLPDATVDVIISNCVINLSPDKDAVFREAYRVLRPGGRMSISDMVVSHALPAAVRGQLDTWAACIAGALPEAEYLTKIRDAGFQDVEIVSRDSMAITPEGASPAEVVAALAGSLGLAEVEIRAMMHEAGLTVADVGSLVASVKVSARKAG